VKKLIYSVVMILILGFANGCADKPTPEVSGPGPALRRCSEGFKHRLFEESLSELLESEKSVWREFADHERTSAAEQRMILSAIYVSKLKRRLGKDDPSESFLVFLFQSYTLLDILKNSVQLKASSIQVDNDAAKRAISLAIEIFCKEKK